MKKKKPQAPQKASVGVNLKDQFNQIVEDELNSLKKQIQSIKVKLNDQITSKISLQKQLNSLELSLKKSKQKLQKREDIISEQLQEIQKLIEANKRLENQLRFEKANDKKSAGMSAKCSSKGVQEVFQQIKRLNQIKTTGHKESALYRSGWNESEYRIISMQAGLIESFIQNSE